MKQFGLKKQNFGREKQDSARGPLDACLLICEVAGGGPMVTQLGVGELTPDLCRPLNMGTDSHGKT
jgi:hypothetical protein